MWSRKCASLYIATICRLFICYLFFFFQAEDGIRDLVRSRGLGDVYKRQDQAMAHLRQEERLALDLHYGHQLTQAEVATVLDLSLIHI